MQIDESKVESRREQDPEVSSNDSCGALKKGKSEGQPGNQAEKY